LGCLPSKNMGAIGPTTNKNNVTIMTRSEDRKSWKTIILQIIVEQASCLFSILNKTGRMPVPQILNQIIQLPLYPTYKNSAKIQLKFLSSPLREDFGY